MPLCPDKRNHHKLIKGANKQSFLSVRLFSLIAGLILNFALYTRQKCSFCRGSNFLFKYIKLYDIIIVNNHILKWGQTMEKHTVKLNICGTDYYINTDDDVKYATDLGNEVDERLTKLLHENSRISVTQAAILLTLEYADMAKKSTDNADNLRGQIKEYLEDSARYKMEAEVARRDIERLSRELKNFQKSGGSNTNF